MLLSPLPVFYTHLHGGMGIKFLNVVLREGGGDQRSPYGPCDRARRDNSEEICRSVAMMLSISHCIVYVGRNVEEHEMLPVYMIGSHH